MEILVNPHIGFNMDFQYIFSNFSTMGTEDYVYNSYGTSYTVNTVKHFNMPGTALGTGINFYY